MHYRRLGRSGLKISEISLGSWLTFGTQLTEKDAIGLVHTAYENGVNFFDNADVNANGQAEEIMGRSIHELPREALIISSKAFFPSMPGPNGRGLSRKHIVESVNASLRRLGTDYLDLFFCQRFDPDTPIDEVVYTMDVLIRQGKILYWGTSEWRAWQISSAFAAASQHHLAPPVVEQPQYNMFHRSRVEIELAPLCKELGIGITTWSPLDNGILTGKYNQGIPEKTRAALESMGWVRDRITPQRIAIVEDLSEIARELGLSTAQLAVAWLLRRKGLSSVITGATHAEQLNENLAAGEAVHLLTDDVLERIEIVLNNQPEE